MTSYWTSIATLVLSCRVSAITVFVCRKPLFRYPSPILGKISGCSPWSRSMMLRSAKIEHPMQANGDIIFEDFQLMWSRYFNVTDGRRDRQTDDFAITSNIALCGHWPSPSLAFLRRSYTASPRVLYTGLTLCYYSHTNWTDWIH